MCIRDSGIPTYFAADIAYHYNKLATRGFAKAIDVWGADHHGHVARMKGAMDAIGPVSYTHLMEHEGLPVPQLIDRLIALAVERTEKQHG